MKKNTAKHALKWVTLVGIIGTVVYAEEKTPQKPAEQTAEQLLEQPVKKSAEQSPKQTAEQRVEQRIQQRWAALRAQDYEKLYNFLSPAKRQVINKFNYASTFGNSLVYKNAEVQSVVCDKDSYKVCEANVYVTYSRKADQADEPLIIGAVLTETWIKESQEWWFSPK